MENMVATFILLGVFAVGFVFGLIAGDSGGYARAVEEANRKNTADTFARYINQMVRGVNDESSS